MPNSFRTDEKKKNDKLRFAHLNQRFSRTKIGRVLLNRIYLRVEDYRREKQLKQLVVSNRLVRSIRHRSFKKLHNLVILGPLDTKQIKSYLTVKQRNPQMSEFIYQITLLGKKKDDLFQGGLQYDESGRPKYGELLLVVIRIKRKTMDCSPVPLFRLDLESSTLTSSFSTTGKWRNSMFPNLSNAQLSWSRFYRLLDAKMNSPKLCFDFSPIHQKSELQKRRAFFNLQIIFSENYKSKTPFDLTFTNYRNEYNSDLRQVLIERALPHFVDLRFDEFGDDLFSENRKLIVLLRNAEKTIEEFDHTANYLLPLILARDDQQASDESDLVHRLSEVPNVELVCVQPKEDLLGRHLNFIFYYQLLVSLREGLDMRQSVKKAAKFHRRLQKI